MSSAIQPESSQTSFNVAREYSYFNKESDRDFQINLMDGPSEYTEPSPDSLEEYEESFNDFFSDDDNDDLEESLDGHLTPKLTMEDDFEQHLGINASKELTAQEAIDSEFESISKLGLIHIAGEDKCGRKIITLFACRLPPHNLIDYDQLFKYLRLTLIQYVSSDYTLIYFHHGLTNLNRPSVSWLVKCYNAFDREFKKNLKVLHLVHPTTFVKVILSIFRPLTSAKVINKINYVGNLEELRAYLDLDRLPIPKRIKNYDLSLNTNKKINGFLGLVFRNPPSFQKNIPIDTHWLPTQQFGVSIEHIRKHQSEDGIAPIMNDCIESIRKIGMKTEGIFRKSIGANIIEEIKTEYNKGRRCDFIQMNDPHIPAVMLKLFIRSLNSSLIPNSLLPTIIRLMDSTPKKQIKLAQTEFIPALEKNAIIVLKKLLEFLYQVSEHAEQNRMTLVNLGIVFGPNLVWLEQFDSLTLSITQQINSFVQFLIENHDRIFISDNI